MSKKSKSEGISRRKFIKDLGSGVVGGSVLVQSLPALSDEQKAQQAPLYAGKVRIDLKVNRQQVRLHVESRTTLAQVLRDQLYLTGTKIICNQGECGGCTVLLNGKAVYSCSILALDAVGKEVITIEGLMSGEKLHPMQQAFIEHDGYQCGFCTPGQIMSAQALLNKNPKPDRKQVKEAMAGNLCRCSAYPNIVDSVLAAAERMLE